MCERGSHDAPRGGDVLRLSGLSCCSKRAPWESWSEGRGDRRVRRVGLRPPVSAKYWFDSFAVYTMPRSNDGSIVANGIMRTHGTLTKWNDDRGFGFVAPSGAGAEIFAHVSAFPRDGVRPHVGEVISFDIETGGDGRKRAIRIQRPGSRSVPRAVKRPASSRVSLAVTLGVLIVGALGGYVYWTTTRAQPDQLRQVAQPIAETVNPEQFTCDGRTRCGQMTSCAEAMYFLQHCPGAQIDGDHDGTPCEEQWCSN